MEAMKKTGDGWLVISREEGEGIKVGENIMVYLSQIYKNRLKAKIAIKAPREMRIERIQTKKSKSDVR
jgi:sRNA-binding carbon storage regulator CsrA